jgi:hypothetical protein
MTALSLAAALALYAFDVFASPIGSTVASRISASNYQHYLDDLLYTHLGMNKGISGAQHDLCRNNIQTTLQNLGLNVQLSPPVGLAERRWKRP